MPVGYPALKPLAVSFPEQGKAGLSTPRTGRHPRAARPVPSLPSSVVLTLDYIAGTGISLLGHTSDRDFLNPRRKLSACGLFSWILCCHLPDVTCKLLADDVSSLCSVTLPPELAMGVEDGAVTLAASQHRRMRPDVCVCQGHGEKAGPHVVEQKLKRELLPY